MVILNDKLSIPTTPPADWGVTQRKHVAKDWRNPIIYTIITAILAVFLFYVVAHRGSLATSFSKNAGEALYALCIGSPIIFAIISFYSWALGSLRPLYEAREARYKASKDWQKNVLMPFIEERYGVAFAPRQTNILSHWSDTVLVNYKGKPAEIRINGIKRDNATDDPMSAYVVIDHDNFSVDEVIKPAKVTYRRLEAL